MACLLHCAVLIGLAATGVNAQTASQAPAPATTSPQSSPADSNVIRGTIPVLLAKSLDSRKLKVGDAIYGKTAVPLHLRNGIMVPSGAKVIGRVTNVQSRAKGDATTTLGMQFDRIEVGNGNVLEMKGVLQALAPNPLEAANPNTGIASPGTLPTGSYGEPPATIPPPTDGVSGPGSFSQIPVVGAKQTMVNGKSTGVTGFPDLELGQDSEIISSGKEIKLNSGTQLLLKAEIH